MLSMNARLLLRALFRGGISPITWLEKPEVLCPWSCVTLGSSSLSIWRQTADWYRNLVPMVKFHRNHSEGLILVSEMNPVMTRTPSSVAAFGERDVESDSSQWNTCHKCIFCTSNMVKHLGQVCRVTVTKCTVFDVFRAFCPAQLSSWFS